jgi:hypothetical protein
MIRRAVVIILTLFFVTLTMPFRVPAWDGLSESSEHFVLFYHPEDAKVALNLLAAAEREYHRVTGTIGFRPSSDIQIYLARDPREFRLLTLGDIPEWGIGAALPLRGRIVLISARHSQGRYDLYQVLVHELSHVVLGLALGDARAPRWLNEGLAMFISHEWKMGQSILVARALLFDSLIPLDEIEDLNFFSKGKAQLAYAESFLTVAFIADRYGEAGLHLLVEELARHGDLDLAMRASLGLSQREFQMIWRDYVTTRFNWASTLSHPLVLWSLMLTLFVVAFFLKRRHTRKIMERWKVEEAGLGELSSLEERDRRWSAP